MWLNLYIYIPNSKCYSTYTIILHVVKSIYLYIYILDIKCYSTYTIILRVVKSIYLYS